MLAIRSRTGPHHAVVPVHPLHEVPGWWLRSGYPPRRCTIVFAVLAVTRFIEDRTGLPIRKFVRTAHRYRAIQIP